jgi:hypothetical protein
MDKITEIFDVHYGNSLELNRLKNIPNGINFVSRTAKNNGVSAKVERLPSIQPFPENTITVALGGSVLETFVQPEPFYTAFHIYCLSPRINMSIQQMLYYCLCIRANKYRYNYGRQANRTLKDIYIPSPEEIPDWVENQKIFNYENSTLPFAAKNIILDTSNWKYFTFDEIFDIRKGKRLTKANMIPGNVPFIGSIDKNNGISNYVGQSANHEGNTITVNYNGSVAEAFYQPTPFWACDDVNVLYPRFPMTPYIALFIITVIKNEKYRFNYGRKWHVDRMKVSRIKLPVKPNGVLDFEYMDNFVKALPFSSVI